MTPTTVGGSLAPLIFVAFLTTADLVCRHVRERGETIADAVSDRVAGAFDSLLSELLIRAINVEAPISLQDFLKLPTS